MLQRRATRVRLLFHTSITSLLKDCVEIAKGHTDASATTRATAAKDAMSDKVDEKKHDVRCPNCLYPGLAADPQTDQVGRLRQQVGMLQATRATACSSELGEPFSMEGVASIVFN